MYYNKEAKDFFENYIITFSDLVNLKDEELKLIEDGRFQSLTDLVLYEQSSPDIEQRKQQINNFYDRLIIDLLMDIQKEFPSCFTLGIDRLNDLLTRYIVYAKDGNLKVPQEVELTLYDYYTNHLKALYRLKELSLLQNTK
jgi:hypothetical protein